MRSDWLVVCCVGVDLRDNAIGFMLEVESDLFVDRFEGLTVTTPRSSECDEDILGGVESSVVEVGVVELESGRRRRRLDGGFDARVLGDTKRIRGRYVG